MPRYKITVEYDGTPFSGWQIQNQSLSVQWVIEQALEIFAKKSIPTMVAGRTDAGVHARGQVFHFDLELDVTPQRVCDAINALVRPHPISCLHGEIVPSDFNARVSARRRHYRYIILNRRAPAMLENMRVWHIIKPLNISVMQQAAQDLLGRHDFTSFRHSECQAKTPTRTLDQLDLRIEGEYLIADISARAFLHHQVRNMIGTLSDIGLGKLPVDGIPEIIAARDRRAAGQNAPPHGLYFMQVDY